MNAAAFGVIGLLWGIGCSFVTAADEPVMSSDKAPVFFAWSWAPPRVRTDLIEPLIWLSPADDEQRLAKQAAVSARRRPELAAILLMGYANPLLRHPDDWYRAADGKNTGLKSPWPEHGIAFVQPRVHHLLDEFTRAGGWIDFLVLDFEDGLSYWAMANDRRAHIRQVVGDPRFAEWIKGGEWGALEDWQRWAMNPGWSKSHVPSSNSPKEAANEVSGGYQTWSVLMTGAVNRALNCTVFAPLRTHFPDARASNYQSYLIQRRYATPERNGHRVWYWGMPLFGDTVSPAYYGIIGQFANLERPAGQRMGKGPFQALLCELNHVRAIRRSSEVEIRPWIQRRSADDSQYLDSPYWRELILHLGLTGVRRFLYFNPISKRGGKPDRVLAADDQALTEALAELMERVGSDGGPATREPLPWDADVIASGWERPDGTVLWRVTVRPGTTRVSVQPGGKVVSVPTDHCGVWLTSTQGEAVSFQAGGNGEPTGAME
jgi:hypothetical protein